MRLWRARNMKPGDTVRIITDALGAALVAELGHGRHATYTATVLDRRGNRVQVLIDGKALWFDAEALTTNLTVCLYQ